MSHSLIKECKLNRVHPTFAYFVAHVSIYRQEHSRYMGPDIEKHQLP